jgi:membrane protein DedA with SNARE-associated domain
MELSSLLFVLPALSPYLFVLSFFVPIIGGGEIGVVGLSLLFGSFGQATIVLFSGAFLGTLVMDSLWFFMARTKLVQRLRPAPRIVSHYRALMQFTRGHDALLLGLSKLMVGTKVFLFLYLAGRKDMPYRSFLRYTFLPTFIWVGVLVSVGVLAAEGFMHAVTVLRGVQIAATTLAFFAFVIFLTQRRIIRHAKKIEQ